MARTTQTVTRDERFSRHYPRLFAYAYAMTGDEETAKEATIAAFANLLDASVLEEHDFAQALYTAARKLLRKHRNAAADGLDADEREVLSLLFDAQLARAEIAELLRVDEPGVQMIMLDGLKKLRAASSDGAADVQRLQTLSA